MIPDNPTFLVHGIASSKNEMVPLQNYLLSQGIETHNIEIGNGELSSIFMAMNEQCAFLAENIKKTFKKKTFKKKTFKKKTFKNHGYASQKSLNKKDKKDKKEKNEKINIIAISQGGLLARCYVEKYTHLPDYPGVDLLLTMGTPHMGIYIPDSPEFYKSFVKDYWKDPFDYDNYLRTNTFLAPLNNEIAHENSSIYKNNILSIKIFIAVWSEIDTVITPYQSAKFEFYNITAAVDEGELTIIDFLNSDEYEADLIGLRTLSNEKRFQNLQYDCQHDKFKSEECFIPILNNV